MLYYICMKRHQQDVHPNSYYSRPEYEHQGNICIIIRNYLKLTALQA